MQSLYADFFEFLNSYAVVYACVLLLLPLISLFLGEKLKHLWCSILNLLFVFTAISCVVESQLLLRGSSLFKFFKPFEADLFMFFLAIIIASLSLLLISFQGIRWQVLKKQGHVDDKITPIHILAGTITLVLTLLFNDFKFGVTLACFFLGIHLRMRRSVMLAEFFLYLIALMYLSPSLSTLNQIALLFWLTVISLLALIAMVSYQLVALKRLPEQIETPQVSTLKDSEASTPPEDNEISIRICIGLGVFIACIFSVLDVNIFLVDGYKLNRLLVRALSFPVALVLFYAGMTLTGHTRRHCMKSAFLGACIFEAIFILWSYYSICNPFHNAWLCN